MSKNKKTVARRLENLVKCQEKICALLGDLSDDAFDLYISIGAGISRQSASSIINGYLKDAVLDKLYYKNLQKNILEEMEGGDQ